MGGKEREVGEQPVEEERKDTRKTLKMESQGTLKILRWESKTFMRPHAHNPVNGAELVGGEDEWVQVPKRWATR